MIRILVIAALVGSCSQQPAQSPIAPGNFAGQGRDRLCIAGEPGSLRGGLVAFGKGDINCAASGRIEEKDGQLSLIPRGEGTCRIPLKINGDVVAVGELPPSCAYYCGPGATMSGKSFTRSDTATPATDLAGDQLC